MQEGGQGKLTLNFASPLICTQVELWLMRLLLQSALVTYVTAGYPTVKDTVDILLGMEAGGAGKITLAVILRGSIANL